MKPEELVFASIEELAPRLRARELSPVELVRTFLNRIDQYDGRLCSYITVTREEALQSAREAEKAMAEGHYLGPLHGIPYAVKDQIYTRGGRTTAGSRVLANFVPEEDATVIQRLKAAGAILLGKLNLSEFAMGGTVHHPYGLPRNPWNLDHAPGSSSSGSGIAVAAGLCTVALGGDTGGSIRNPASFCGVVGLKPTNGLVSRCGSVPLSWSMDTLGPLTHTVRDCAWVLGVIAGYDSRDPLTSRRPVPDYTARLDQGLQGVRLGVVRELLYSEIIHPEVQQAVKTAIAQLAKLGASVEEVSVPLIRYSGAIYMTLCEVDNPRLHEARLRTSPADYDYATRLRLFLASLIPASFASKAQRARARLRQEMFRVLKQVDVLVTPTTSFPAPRIEDTLTRFRTKEEVVRRVYAVRNNGTSFSMSGLPALSVPCGFTQSGLPIGLQIGGRLFGEDVVFQVAQAYQQATDWHKRHPSL